MRRAHRCGIGASRQAIEELLECHTAHLRLGLLNGLPPELSARQDTSARRSTSALREAILSLHLASGNAPRGARLGRPPWRQPDRHTRSPAGAGGRRPGRPGPSAACSRSRRDRPMRLGKSTRFARPWSRRWHGSLRGHAATAGQKHKLGQAGRSRRRIAPGLSAGGRPHAAAPIC